MLSFVTTAMKFLAFQWNGVEVDDKFAYLKTLSDSLQSILWPVLIVIASAATIYSIYIGVMMAKAEESSERDKFKTRFFNVLIAAIVVIVIILLMQLVVIPNLSGWLGSMS